MYYDDLGNKMPKAGGTFTGAINLANNVWNNIGDDAKLGDVNVGGQIGIQGINGNTGICFKPYSGSTTQSITTDGAGNMEVTGSMFTVPNLFTRGGIDVGAQFGPYIYSESGDVRFRCGSNGSYDYYAGVKEMFQYQGLTDNLNWCTKHGIYKWDTNTFMKPEDYGVVQVWHTGQTGGYTGYDWVYQLAFTTNNHIYFRCNINATTSQADSGWTQWQTIATQENFQAGVNAVYNAVSARGVTPASTSLSDVLNAIGQLSKPSGTMNITANGWYDISAYATVNVGVSSGHNISVATVIESTTWDDDTERRSKVTFSATSGYVYAIAWGGIAGFAGSPSCSGGSILGWVNKTHTASDVVSGCGLFIVQATSGTVTLTATGSWPYKGLATVIRVTT